METIQALVSKLLDSAINVFKEFGASDKEIRDGFKQAKSWLKVLNLDDKETVDEVCKAVDEKNKKLAFSSNLSLTLNEKTTLNQILENAYDTTVLYTDKEFTKEELKALKKNIESIKKKLK